RSIKVRLRYVPSLAVPLIGGGFPHWAFFFQETPYESCKAGRPRSVVRSLPGARLCRQPIHAVARGAHAPGRPDGADPGVPSPPEEEVDGSPTRRLAASRRYRAGAGAAGGIATDAFPALLELCRATTRALARGR